MPLTQGYFTLIDDADGPLVLTHRWKVLKSRDKRYACRTQTRRNASDGKVYKTILMHRAILGLDENDPFEVDHRDGDGLNNQRHNLRRATRPQNLTNQSKRKGKSRYKGVYWNKAKGMWQAQIGNQVNHRVSVIYLGRFVTEEEAARAYDEKAFELHGEFAQLNFPKVQ